MSVKVVIYGEKLDLADDLMDEFHQDAKDAVGAAADVLLADVQRRLSRVGEPAEGEAPRQQTGELYASFKRIAPRIKGAVATSGIRSNHPGANRLEYGATDSRGIRTLPHPYVRPAIEATKGEIDRLLQDRLT